MLSGYQNILIALIPVYIFIAGGYLFRKIGWLTEPADKSLLKLQINVFYPCLIFSYIFQNESLKDLTLLIYPPLMGFLSILLGFAVSYLLAVLFGFQKGRGKRTFAFTSGIYNYGFIAIPLTHAVYNSKAVTGTLMVYNTGIELAIWTIGILLLTGKFERGLWKKMINAPVIALLVGITFNFIVPNTDPDPTFLSKSFQSLMETISWLGTCAIPLALILIGASVNDLLGKDSFSPSWKIMTGGCLSRLLILPALFMLAALLIPMPIELKSVILIQAAMPSGMFPIIMARHYEGSPKVAVQIVLSTTLLSFLTIPFWVTIGQKLIQP